MNKGYSCNRFPFLSIGPSINFKDGFFETENAELQKVLESHDWWNVHISPGARGDAGGTPPPAPPAAVPPAAAAARRGIARQGMRGSR